MSKSFWAIIAIIVIIFGGIVVFNKKDSANNDTAAQPSSHIIGEGTTGVTLVEYADFQCPFCAQYSPLIKQVVEKYNDKITFQFRHLPLIQIHQHALAAAKATEAAHKQGKFWEMHDIIFQNQNSWKDANDATDIFEQYAQQLSLNIEQYKLDAASAEVNDVVQADIAEFYKTKEEVSTPTYFLDGKKIQATSLEGFSKLINEAIANKSKQTNE